MSASSTKSLPARGRADALAQHQACVVARRQVLDAGLSDEWIARQLASRRWQRVHPGVYATVTGQLTRQARWFAAVLYGGQGAVLADDAALQAGGMKTPARDAAPITIAVDHCRRVRDTRGVRVIRVRNLARLVHPARLPARLRLEAALLIKASRAHLLDDAVAVLADACQQRVTTPRRLREQLTVLPANLRHRPVISEILDDVDSGAYSFLEIHYLRDVERPHGLPTGSRQRRVTVGHRIWFRDVEYVGLELVVELDGRLGHERFDDRARDMTRDNDAALSRRRTLRAGYRHTMSEACDTAVVVIHMLRQQGWRGTPKACGPDCPVGSIVHAGESSPTESGGNVSPAA